MVKVPIHTGAIDGIITLIGISKNFKTKEVVIVKNNEKIYNLSVKCWPALSIFDEISKYPEFATPLMIRRLMRIRKTTESFFYDLEKKLDIDKNPKNYIYYKGNIIKKPFNEFIKKEGIILK